MTLTDDGGGTTVRAVPRFVPPEIDFDWLLQEIRYGNVVPVIGPELYTDADGTPLEQVVARRLVTDLSLDLPPVVSLRDVALAYLSARGASAYNSLKARTRDAVQAVITRPPLPIQQLAEIGTFPLYVTTTPDDMLEVALRAANRPVRSVTYREMPDVDLPDDLRRSEAATVVHVFGSVSESFALTDADLLEYVQSLASEKLSPRKLFDELAPRSLLFLGCGFPDWLTKLFIRVMRKTPFGEREKRTQVIADALVSRDERLMLFLRHYDLQLYPAGRAIEFVGQIHERWQKTQAPPPVSPTKSPPALPEGAVFLSFSSLDRADVSKIAATLHDRGIDVFIDEADIEYGADWDRVIIENLTRAVLFIPFISKNTEMLAETPKYFWREWNLAHARAAYYAPGIKFILPVKLDEIDPAQARVPEAFRVPQWFELHERTATDKFVDYIQSEYRRKRLRAR
jgi:TIR domain/SIR2-like domain